MQYSEDIGNGKSAHHRPCAAGSTWRALTLLEMVVSLAIMAVVFAAVLPQFRNIHNSWASKRGSSEAVQNGRILIDHMNRNLSSAVKITSVSAPDVTDGFIEFEANDEITYRYDISSGGYVRFGAVGSLSELAGPVNRLQFTCYDAYDLDSPAIEAASIRCVEAATTLINSAELGRDKTFSTMAYLRTNGQNQDIFPGIPLEYDERRGRTAVLIKVENNRFLCVYTGHKDNGSATILTVDTDSWQITQGAAVVYDIKKGKAPAVSKFEKGSDDDTARYLCVYQGLGEDGMAVILNVDLNTWDISMETPFEYDTEKAKDPALVQIDDTNYLCAYNSEDGDGWAVVLSVDKDTFEITKQTPFEFDTVKGKTPALADMGTGKRNYLCAYTGGGDDGWAVVLTVDKKDMTITKATPYEFDIFMGKTPALHKIKAGKFLCAYSGGPEKDHGWAVVLNVNSRLQITKSTPFEFNSIEGKTPALDAVNFMPNGVNKRSDFLCAYSGDKDHGRAVILRVDETTWKIKKSKTLDYDDIDYDGFFKSLDDKARIPALCEADQTHFLCAYASGPRKDYGWTVIFDVDNPLLP